MLMQIIKMTYYIQKNEKYSKRLNKIEELTKKIDDNNLIFTAVSTRETVDFSGKIDPLTFLKKIRDG